MNTEETQVRARRSATTKTNTSDDAAAKPPTRKRGGAAKQAGARQPDAAKRRSARGGLVVAVTGAAQGIGEQLVRHLTSSEAVRSGAVRSGAVKKVVAIDTIRGDAPDATWRLADVCDPTVADRLGGVDVVVHLAVDIDSTDERPDRNSANVRGTATVLTAAAAAGVKHVVLVTSAMVYGAQADNAVPLAEESPLLAAPDSALLGDLLEMERLAAQAPRTHPGIAVTVLRPAALVGPGVDTLVTRHFEAPRLLALKGAHMSWQFCHVDDLISAIEAAIAQGGETDGDRHRVVAVGSAGWLDQHDVERVTGKRHIELPSAVAFVTAERLHRLGATPASASDLHFLVYPWVVESTWLAEHGWAPVHDNEDALRAALAESSGRLAIGGHRLGRRDAAAGAAVGATVALVGTAALVRRARRRRRG
jgi:nucleoside-diphosphate-sugar epimerase